MLFASITEFGAVSAGYRKVLDDLRGRQRRLDLLLEEERLFAATLGPTDLVEILLFDSFFPLSEVGGSGAQAFRRASGVWCPQPGQDGIDTPPLGLPAYASELAEVCCIQDAMAEDPARPFLAVIYAKSSPIARLCLPPQGEEGGEQLIRAMLRLFLNPDSDVWSEDLRTYRQHAVGYSRWPEDLPPLRVAPLGGLDSVDLVFLVRASRLEQVGAVAWALRKQSMGVTWPAARFPRAVENARRLLGMQGQVIDDESWDESPLFSNTSSTLGVPIRVREQRPERAHLVGQYSPDHLGPWWMLESPQGSTWPAADEMALLVRYRFMPGFFRTVGDALPGALSDVDEGSLLQLFGQRDALAYNQRILQEPHQIQPVSRYAVDDLLSFMSSLTGAAERPPPSGVSSVTEIALVVHHPRRLREVMPGNTLIDAFRARLEGVRDFHLQRRATDFPGPWIGTWLQGAKVAGLSYPVTNGVLNLICSVLDYLDEDLENFMDLLPPIRILVEWADAYRRQAGVDRILERPLTDEDISFWTWEIWQHLRDQPLPPQLREAGAFARFYENLEQLATFRGRRDHPLRAPNGTLAFEGHAGYRVARDAFITYVKTLARQYDLTSRDIEDRIIILDSSTGRPTCAAEPGGTAVVRVSAMAVHHPLHWVFGHEIAHARFAHTKVNSRPDLFRAGHALVDAAGLPRNLLRGTIEELLSAVGNSLWDEFASDEGSPFCRAIADVLTEVPADLLEWRSLMVQGDAPGQAARRFWFVTGPGFVLGLRDIFGRAPIGLRRVRRLIVRVFFVSRFIQQRLIPETWREDLQDLCEWMFLNREAMGDDRRMEPLGRMADAPLIERLRCVKEDLDIPDEHWCAAVVNLVLDRSVTSRQGEEDWGQFRRVQEVVDAWIPFVEALMGLGPTAATDDARAIYARYLDNLMNLPGWEHADPWPHFIPGHPAPDLFEQHTAHRKGRRRPTYLTPALSQRGGVMLASAAHRQAYHDLTLRCILTLDDLSRKRRRRTLADYLEQGERGIRSSMPPSKIP
ncbi:MAG: hypothetical protein H6739_33900 [Alphaproteobacteria bacterium]|nr:hypothetical protein [Alphaproteobacteria bacterium]